MGLCELLVRGCCSRSPVHTGDLAGWGGWLKMSRQASGHPSPSPEAAENAAQIFGLGHPGAFKGTGQGYPGGNSDLLIQERLGQDWAFLVEGDQLEDR